MLRIAGGHDVAGLKRGRVGPSVDDLVDDSNPAGVEILCPARDRGPDFVGTAADDEKRAFRFRGPGVDELVGAFTVGVFACGEKDGSVMLDAEPVSSIKLRDRGGDLRTPRKQRDRSPWTHRIVDPMIERGESSGGSSQTTPSEFSSHGESDPAAPIAHVRLVQDQAGLFRTKQVVSARSSAEEESHGVGTWYHHSIRLRPRDLLGDRIDFDAAVAIIDSSMSGVGPGQRPTNLDSIFGDPLGCEFEHSSR